MFKRFLNKKPISQEPTVKKKVKFIQYGDVRPEEPKTTLTSTIKITTRKHVLLNEETTMKILIKTENFQVNLIQNYTKRKTNKIHSSKNLHI